MINLKVGGIIVAAFITGAFVASPELRAYAASTIGSDDIINESIRSEDIKNGQVKASDIATDAVGAAEIQGVTKLLFARCNPDSKAGFGGSQGIHIVVQCNITGVDSDDNAIATLTGSNNDCFIVYSTAPAAGKVEVSLMNVCTTDEGISAGDTISIIVYDK